MKLNKALLPQGKTIISEEDIVFPDDLYDEYHLRKINGCHVVLHSTMYDNFLRVEINIKADVVTGCAYTLEDVDLTLKIHDEIIFSETEEDEDIYYEPNNIIEMDGYIYSIILANTPMKVVKKGAKLPDGGDSYRVISEDEFEEERKNHKDDRWSKLDELDID